jgi:hypothetical protein
MENATRMRVLSLRVPEPVAERLEALVPYLAEDATIAALGIVSTSTAARLAVGRGIEALEEEYGVRRPRKRKKRPGAGSG